MAICEFIFICMVICRNTPGYLSTFREIRIASVWIVIGFIMFSGMDIIFARNFNGGYSVINGPSRSDI